MTNADFASLSDNDLQVLRAEPKVVLNPRAREVKKGAHIEQNFDLRAAGDPHRMYRIYVRQSATQPSAFSVGLLLNLPSGDLVTLVRYNGPSHAHQNRLERTRLPTGTHRHAFTRRYVDAGLRGDAFAEANTRYDDANGALRCLVQDCSITGLVVPPDQPSLLP